MRLLTLQITTQNGESVDGESGSSVAIDLNHVSEGSLGQEGTIIITGEDGSQSKFVLSVMSVCLKCLGDFLIYHKM